MKISGIYQIQSKIKPERVYIGSAMSIQARQLKHYSELRRNVHHSSKLQRHFNKYGKDDLQFSILCTCEKDQLIQFEQYFLDFYHPYFNTCKIAGSRLGSKHTKGSLKLMSIIHTGKQHALGYHHTDKAKAILRLKLKGNKNALGYKQSKETIDKRSVTRSIPVIQYDKYGVFVKEWDSATSAQKELGISKKDISGCLRKAYKHKTAGGFVWKYKEIA